MSSPDQPELPVAATPASPPAVKPAKPMFPPSRIAFLVFVAITIPIIIWEGLANLGHRSALGRLTKEFAAAEDEGSRQELTRDSVSQILRRGPKPRPASSDAAAFAAMKNASTSKTEWKIEETQVYVWSGLLKTYRIWVQYDETGYMRQFSG